MLHQKISKLPKNYFPSDVLKWMKLNATPRMALKLMQLCKYFQHNKFPYFVIKNLHGDLNRWDFQTLLDKTYQRIELKDLPENLWIIGDLCLLSKTETLSFLMSKIAVCDIQILYFIDQNITFEQFKILTDGGKVEVINLNKTFINDENGEPVPLENLFDCLPNVKRFSIYFISNSFVSSEIATKKVPQKLKEFRLSSIGMDFNVDECVKFILNNQQIYFILDVDYSVPKKVLDGIANKVIQIWSPQKRPPYIAFGGETNRSLEKFGDDYRRFYFKR